MGDFIVRLGVLLSAALVIGVVSGADAQEQANSCDRLVQNNSCLCAIPVEWIQNNQAAALANSSPDVRVTTQAGYTPIAADGTAALFLGDNVVVPANAGATLVMGTNCAKQIPENSSLVIRTESECACAALVTVRGVPIFPIIAGGAGAAGAVILVVTQTGQEPASP
jgi:hypothetical protein